MAQQAFNYLGLSGFGAFTPPSQPTRQNYSFSFCQREENKAGRSFYGIYDAYGYCNSDEGSNILLLPDGLFLCLLSA
jgi:hypothetical protein